jgi:hypothetical protein
MPESGEGYVIVDLRVLQAIRDLDWIERVDWRFVPSIRLTLRVARVDPVSGTLVIAAKLARDLHEQPPEPGPPQT